MTFVLMQVRKSYIPLGSLGSKQNMSTDRTRDHTMFLLLQHYCDFLHNRLMVIVTN